MRFLVFATATMAIASVFFLYGLGNETRTLRARVQAQEQAAERARNDIAVLRAERAHLARPERIDGLARAQGLGPATAKQLSTDPRALTAQRGDLTQ